MIFFKRHSFQLKRLLKIRLMKIHRVFILLFKCMNKK